MTTGRTIEDWFCTHVGSRPFGGSCRSCILSSLACFNLCTPPLLCIIAEQQCWLAIAASLKKMMPNKCTVTRDGHEQKVEAHELVPGDFVRLYIGDRVPADVRLIETADLKVLGVASSPATP